MARLDMEEYRRKYLRVVEEHLLQDHKGIQNFTPQLLSDAIREELNLSADEESWMVDVNDDFNKAVMDAEKRIIGIMKENRDLGLGKAS